MKLLSYQQKIVNYIVANKDKQIILCWTRQMGYTTIMKEVARRLNEKI